MHNHAYCPPCAARIPITGQETKSGVEYQCPSCRVMWSESDDLDQAYALLSDQTWNQGSTYVRQANAARASALVLLEINANLARIATALERSHA